MQVKVITKAWEPEIKLGSILEVVNNVKKEGYWISETEIMLSEVKEEIEAGRVEPIGKNDIKYNLHSVSLTESEIQALQKILGFFLVHTSKDIYSVMEKLDNIIGSDFIDYSDVVFSKTDADGCEIKKYKHQNFSISFKE